VKVVKNKIAPPFRNAEFDVIFGYGISRASDVLDLAVVHGLVTKAGTYYNYGEERLGQGRDNARQALEKNPQQLAALEASLRAKLTPDRNALPVAEEPENEELD
jgi:recombination protein RecA